MFPAGKFAIFFPKMPQTISPGACIGIVAPAGIPEPDLLQKGIALIRERGYRVRLADQVDAKGPYALAGNDEERAEALMRSFEDPTIDAVWMARGGYGSTRLFSLLDPERIRPFPKRFMGCSDGTALLAFFSKACGMAALHGPVVTQLGKLAPGLSEKSFHALEKGMAFPLESGKVLQKGSSAGKLVGGNLTLLASLLGTPWCPDFEGAVLFVEEVNEGPYRVDRMFCHLKMAGVFEKVTGLLLGSFTGCGEKEEIHARILAHIPSGLPVIAELPFGHGPCHVPLAFGAPAVLDTENLLPLKEGDHAGT